MREDYSGPLDRTRKKNVNSRRDERKTCYYTPPRKERRKALLAKEEL